MPSGRRGRDLAAIACVAIAAWAGRAAGPPEAKLVVTPAVATVGAKLEARLRVEAPEGFAAEPPGVPTELGPFSVTEPSWEGPAEEGGRKVWTWKAKLAAFETGDLEVPAIEVGLRGPGGPATVATSPVKIRIESVLGKDAGEAEIADLKPPAVIPPDYRPLFAALLALVGIVALALAAWRLWRRYSSRLAAVPAPEDPFRRMPPHEWAYAELSALLERWGESSGNAAAFFSELTRILKLYLGGRFRTDLMESTTEEVAPVLEEAGAPREATRAARSLLGLADRVKFAREAPPLGSRRAAVEEAYRIVDATRPIEEAARPGEEGAA